MCDGVLFLPTNRWLALDVGSLFYTLAFLIYNSSCDFVFQVERTQTCFPSYHLFIHNSKYVLNVYFLFVIGSFKMHFFKSLHFLHNIKTILSCNVTTT